MSLAKSAYQSREAYAKPWAVWFMLPVSGTFEKIADTPY
jgi:hypothetical protein